MADISFKSGRYEYDPKGNNPNNLVVDEMHEVEDRQKKVLIPLYAYFYTDSVVIKDLDNDRILQSNEYFFDDHSQIIFENTNLPAAGAIIITSPTAGLRYAIKYQVVGGAASGKHKVDILAKFKEINLDDRKVDWANIVNKQTTYPPQGHKHPMWQTYAYGQLIHMLEQLKNARLIGDSAMLGLLFEKFHALSDELRAYTRKNINELNETIEQLKNTDLSNLVTRAIYDKAVGELTRATAALGDAVKEVQTALSDKASNTGVTRLLQGTHDDLTNTFTAAIEAASKALKELVSSTSAADKSTLTTEYGKEVALLTNALLGKMFNGALTPYKLNAKEETINLSVKELDDYIERNIPSNLKLRESVIPISTTEYNGLRWSKDGLYIGTSTEDIYKNIYVDPDTGKDEVITVENHRGSRNKPVASIAFALSQGPANVTRVIHVAEGKTHIIGREVTDYSDGQIVYKPLPENMLNVGVATARGGVITIRPYGVGVDAVPPNPGDSIWRKRPRELIQLDTKIMLVGWSLGDSNGFGGKWVTPEVLDVQTGTHLTISNCKIINEVYRAQLQKKIFTGTNHKYVTNNSRITRRDNININLLNCTYSTTDLTYNGPNDTDIHYIALVSGNSVARPKLNVYWLEETEDNYEYRNNNLLQGPSPLIGTFFPIVQIIVDIGTLDANMFDRLFAFNDHWSQGNRGKFFYGFGTRNGRFYRVDTNLDAPDLYRVKNNDPVFYVGPNGLNVKFWNGTKVVDKLVASST